ncbi:MAG TPA: LytR C-terminal domain-containing protein [Jatrophihabitans sp.]|nr:LytR C-terminal domain-containing protein [Jatrophihabitans sp.]
MGVLLVVVGAAVAILAVTALNHPNGRLATRASQSISSSSAASRPASSPSPSPTASHSQGSATSSPAGSGRLPLVVLNNTSQVSASTAADRFRQGGWTVTDTNTFDGSILSTAVYYDPAVSGAQAAADALQQQFPAIKRVKEKFDGLPDGPLIVVLTSDYS